MGHWFAWSEKLNAARGKVNGIDCKTSSAQKCESLAMAARDSHRDAAVSPHMRCGAAKIDAKEQIFYG